MVKATNGASRVSAYMLRDAILRFYTNNNLFPAGLCADAECTRTWALKHGNALKKLVALLKKTSCHSISGHTCQVLCASSGWPHPSHLQESQDFQGSQAEPFEAKNRWFGNFQLGPFS